MQIPYQLVKACSDAERYAAMRCAVARQIPRLIPVPLDTSPHHRLIVACYGPSLLDTWPTIREQALAGHPILSMSGATRFLVDRGIMPTYHVDMDPRAHKLQHLDPPIDGIEYLMASCCPPETWDRLSQQRIRLWHARQDKTTVDWVERYDPHHTKITIWTGSTIGLGGLHVGGALGYCHYEIHGMDSSFAVADPTARHAGPHYGPSQEKHRCTWDAERVTYQTTRIMANACAEVINTLAQSPIFCVFHGAGLLQALVREADFANACTANQIEKTALVRRSYPTFCTLPTLPATALTTGIWQSLLDQLPADALPELLRFAQQAAALRHRARYNTGTISIETALQLRAVCHHYQPAIVCEIGTFIGTSTYALHATRHLYTCDRSNDCILSTDNIITHPFVSSTLLFQTLLLRGIRVDCFFFDGRLSDEDVLLIQALSTPHTIYLLDDCSTTPGADKGLANLQTLQPFLAASHVYIPPYDQFVGRSTLGMLVPFTAQVPSIGIPKEEAA